ncbi:hypothetical protein CJF42_10175 [Pseudoalteromonas sp. NBT06-2]|uniref:hypothetical protein n=1 Tax=Pseudoalteromonas sp. NBT06-2 TaxID=2025950 RepID=UPI000BC7401A|nr:hypothetical protein [Pseudoalteromonas sp. NBT06-2]PAJ74470.1 hypothetical protein CJF42_10175 [Pseudoalteromonas sp. NBT06-2]
MKINNHSLLFYCVILLFRCILEFSYIKLINPIYGSSYLHFGFNFSILEYLISWIFFLLSLFFLKSKMTKVSDFATLTLIVSVIIPVSVISGYDAERSVVPLLLLFIPLISIWFFCDFKAVKPLKLPQFKNSELILKLTSWVMVSYLILLYILTGAVFNANLDFTKVYEFRDVNSKLTDFGVFSYLNIWAYKVFAAFLFCTSLLARRFGLCLVIFFIYTFFYAINNHKAVFFLPFLLLSIWYYFKKTNSALVIPLGLGFLILSVLSINFFIDIQYLASMVIRRLFFVPAGLTFDYYDFTNLYGHIYWRDSVLSFLGGYQHDLPLSFAVGKYLLSDELGANNGFVSSGYAHAGIFGVSFYSFVFAYILRLLDHVTENGIPLWLSLALTAIPIRSMIISSDFFTVMLTHGLFITTLILLVMPKGKHK